MYRGRRGSPGLIDSSVAAVTGRVRSRLSQWAPPARGLLRGGRLDGVTFKPVGSLVLASYSTTAVDDGVVVGVDLFATVLVEDVSLRDLFRHTDDFTGSVDAPVLRQFENGDFQSAAPVYSVVSCSGWSRTNKARE